MSPFGNPVTRFRWPVGVVFGEGAVSPRGAGSSHGDLLARHNVSDVSLHVVVAVPGVVAVVVVARDVGDAGHVGSVVHALAEADDGVDLPRGLEIAHEHEIANADVGDGHLDGIEEGAEPKLGGHGLIEASQHVVEVVLVLLAGLRELMPARDVVVAIELLLDAADDLPAVDDVDAVVALVAEPVESVDAHA